MVTPQTESTNMKTWQEAGWSITPQNVSVLEVAPPAPHIDLRDAEPYEQEIGGTFEFLVPSSRGTVDTLTHQTLLEESLQRYEDIWGTLADR